MIEIVMIGRSIIGRVKNKASKMDIVRGDNSAK